MGWSADMTNDEDSAGDAPYLRRIRSFVLREGRMTSGQQRAFDDDWCRFGLDYTASERDLETTFGR